MTLLQVSHLSKQNKAVVALDDVSFTYNSFRRIAIAGETGSGKTTLLKAIAGLVQVDSGDVLLEGERVVGPDDKLIPGHQRIAYLSQHFELRNNYRVDDYLEMASKLDTQQRRRVYELCQVDHLLNRKTDQLSGGERQRTALARLLTTRPRLLLLDEPYSNLDGIHKHTLKGVIDDVVAEGYTSCLMVSHDPADVLPWAEEVLVLKNGRLVQQGTPQQVYSRPVSKYAGALFGDYNLLSAKQVETVFNLPVPSGARCFFIRPENIAVERVDDGNNGSVTAVRFFGSYNEVMINCNGAMLLAKTGGEGLETGDRVSVSVQQKHLWPL